VTWLLGAILFVAILGVLVLAHVSNEVEKVARLLASISRDLDKLADTQNETNFALDRIKLDTERMPKVQREGDWLDDMIAKHPPPVT
jgi:hypothetical protein